MNDQSDQRLDRGPEGKSHFTERIFDARRNLGVDRSCDDAVLLQILELLDQHFQVHAPHTPFQLREAQGRLCREQLEDDDDLPLALQRPLAPDYCTNLTRAEMGPALAAVEAARLPKRRDLSVAAILERVGGGTTNPDANYGVRLSRALFM